MAAVKSSASDSMLHMLLHRYCRDVRDISRYLAPTEQAVFEKSTEKFSDPLSLLDQPKQLLDAVHYSWFVAPIAALPKSLQDPTIAALAPAQSQGVCRLMKRPEPTGRPSPDFRDFLLESLVKALEVRKQVPIRHLPESPLSPLALYPKDKLQRLIQLLGVRDLAQELRLIVNKVHQAKLLQSLNEEERRFLDFYLFKEVEKLTVPRLDLKDWTGDAESVREQLHLRGLGRLGRALVEQNPSLVWHVTHRLDSGRAAVMKRSTSLPSTESVRVELQRQVIGLIHYMGT